MLLAHKDDYYETPEYILDMIKNKTGRKINFDVCATKENAVADDCYTEQDDALNKPWMIYDGRGEMKTVFCNPPRSKNGKFVNKAFQQWSDYNIDIFMLMCWNDLGNQYGEKLIGHIISKDIRVWNLGKVIFNKNGVKSQFPSRLTYMLVWFKKR